MAQPRQGSVIPPTKTQATVPVETLASMSGRRSALRTGQVAVETGAVLGLDVVAFAGSVRDQGGRGAPQLPSGPNAANAEARKRFANLRHPSGNKVRHPSG